MSNSIPAPWTVAHQAPLSMGFSRQEYWNGLPFSSPGDLLDPGIELESSAWQMNSFLLSHLGSPGFCYPGLFSLPQSPWVHSLLKAFAHSVPSLGCSSSRSLQHCHHSQKGTTVSKVAPIPNPRFRDTVSLHLHIIFIALTALWDYSGHMYVYGRPS